MQLIFLLPLFVLVLVGLAKVQTDTGGCVKTGSGGCVKVGCNNCPETCPCSDSKWGTLRSGCSAGDTITCDGNTFYCSYDISFTIEFYENDDTCSTKTNEASCTVRVKADETTPEALCAYTGAGSAIDWCDADEDGFTDVNGLDLTIENNCWTITADATMPDTGSAVGPQAEGDGATPQSSTFTTKGCVEADNSTQSAKLIIDGVSAVV